MLIVGWVLWGCVVVDWVSVERDGVVVSRPVQSVSDLRELWWVLWVCWLVRVGFWVVLGLVVCNSVWVVLSLFGVV